MTAEQQQDWTIQRMLNWTVGYLERKGDERPRLSAEWLLSAVTGLSRIELYTSFDKPLSGDELKRMHDAVLRRGKGEPLQYVTGEMPFRHIIVRCEEGVLIPRPETELLVDAALEQVDAARAAGHTAQVLELGCGSGCIACSIASERPQTHVVATDIEPRAVALTKRNRDALGLLLSIDVIESDLAAQVNQAFMGCFDVLISNPPYIPSDIVDTLPFEVAGFEPHLALDGGPDGLDIFRRILEIAPKALRSGGMLCCELFEKNVHQAAELCRQQGDWAKIEVREDLTHRPRMLVAVREGDLSEGGERVETVRSLNVNQDVPNAAVVKEVARVLLDGGVAIVPTDSVYGIGCAALPYNPGLEKTFAIKRRDLSQTLPWLIADVRDLDIYGRSVPAWAYALAREFWPGALTLVVQASELVPAEYRRSSDGSIALRLPQSNIVRAIARELGVPLAITSANTHGEAAAVSGASLEERLVKAVDVVLDAGPAPLAIASSIVDCTGEQPRLVREGAISAAELMRVAGFA